MLKLRKAMSRVALITALGLLLVACGGDDGGGTTDGGDVAGDTEDPGADVDGEDGDETIGFVVKALDQEFWLTVKEGAETAGEELGVELFLDGASSETAVEEQLALIEDMITRGVDALVVAPTAPEQSEPVLQRAVDQGIPVLLVDTDLPDWDGKLTFIGTDNLAAGEAAGEWIADELGGEGTLAILRGVPGNTSTDARADGATQVLEDAGIEVVADLAANSDRAEGRSVMEDILTSQPDIDAVFAANDQMALGALEAVEAAGIDHDDIIIVGFDATSEAAESILDGGMDASVAQMTAAMGSTGVEEAVRAARGEDVESRIDTGYEIVTEDNAEDYTD